MLAVGRGRDGRRRFYLHSLCVTGWESDKNGRIPAILAAPWLRLTLHRCIVANLFIRSQCILRARVAATSRHRRASSNELLFDLIPRTLLR